VKKLFLIFAALASLAFSNGTTAASAEKWWYCDRMNFDVIKTIVRTQVFESNKTRIEISDAYNKYFSGPGKGNCYGHASQAQAEASIDYQERDPDMKKWSIKRIEWASD
jgi:hypothetical protein